MKTLAVIAVVILALMSTPSARADAIECQVQGILVIVALEGPVTVCSTDPTVAHNDPVLEPAKPNPVRKPSAR